MLLLQVIEGRTWRKVVEEGSRGRKWRKEGRKEGRKEVEEGIKEGTATGDRRTDGWMEESGGRN